MKSPPESLRRPVKPPEELSRAAAQPGIRPISVMLIIGSLEYGGAERQVVEMVRTWDRKRVRPVICSLSPRVPLADLLENREAELEIVEKRSRFDVTTIPRIASVMRRRRIDVVHAFLFDAEIAARFAALLARVPVVIASERNTDYERPLLHKFFHALTRPLYHAMIANSQAGKDFDIRTLGLPPDMIHVIHNGVDIVKFRVNRDSGNAVRKELGIPPAAAVVGIVASFKRQKRHEDFLQMAAGVLSSRPNTWFVIAGETLVGNQQGSDDYHSEIRNLVRQLGIEQKCLFVGARKDIPAIYNACDVTVLPSSREGTPNVLLESMASGIPVVATEIADNSRIVKQGATGYLVSVGDVPGLIRHVGQLLDNPEKRLEMGEAARQWVAEGFSFATAARKTEEVYRRYLLEKGIQ